MSIGLQNNHFLSCAWVFLPEGFTQFLPTRCILLETHLCAKTALGPRVHQDSFQSKIDIYHKSYYIQNTYAHTNKHIDNTNLWGIVVIHFGPEKEKSVSHRDMSPTHRETLAIIHHGEAKGMTVISSKSNVIDYTYVNKHTVSVPGEKIVPSFRSSEYCTTGTCGKIIFLDNTETKVTRINATNSTTWTIHNARTWVHHAPSRIHVWCYTHQSLLFFCKRNIYNFCWI